MAWPFMASTASSSDALAAAVRASSSGPKIASCASCVQLLLALPKERRERASSGSRASSGIAVVVGHIAGEDEVGQCGWRSGARLEPKREVRQAIGGESVTREPGGDDGALDLLGRAFHFHEIIHARVVLEADHRTLVFVLRDLA